MAQVPSSRIQISNSERIHVRILAARCARGLLSNLLALQSEGAGNAGRPMRPISRVQWVVVEGTRVSQVTPESPGTPRAMVYGLYVISPAIGFLASVACGTDRKLDTSTEVSGPYDFAVHFRRPRQERHPRPPHPRPALMTLRNAPLNGTGWLSI